MTTRMVFRRTGIINSNGSVPGELTIGEKTWPTIERGEGHTFVRQGTYRLMMCWKISGSRVPCLCFHEDRAISSHLIHRALKDSHLALEGCIAPGLTCDGNGIKNSKEAMEEVFSALDKFVEWKTGITIEVQNNIGNGKETKDRWLKRRKEMLKRREEEPK